MKSSRTPLRPAQIDLSSPRTQLILGMCAAVLNCALTDHTGLISLGFLLHITLTVLAGLITFEITGLYGNRSGAMPAIWSAFLLSCYPACSTGAASKFGLSDFFAFFILLSFYLYQRYRLLKEAPYLVAAIACFIFSVIAGGVVALSLSFMPLLYELVFRSSPAFLCRLEAEDVPIIINPFMTATRLMFLGMAWMAMSLVFQMGSATLDPAARYASVALPVLVFCIFFPLLIFPVSGAPNQKQAQLISIIGMVFLTIAAFSFHSLQGSECLF